MRREPVPAGAVKPEFIQRIQDVEIVEGSAAKFDVRVKGNSSLISRFYFSQYACVNKNKKKVHCTDYFTEVRLRMLV